MSLILDGTTGVPVTTVTGTLPVANGGTGVTTSTGTGAVVLGTSPSISGAVLSTMASSVITSGTAVASTSGTSIDFTGIPSWVKRITVMFNGVSTVGAASTNLIQLGTSGGIEITGYISASSVTSTTSASQSAVTGFAIYSGGSADYIIGAFTIHQLSTSPNLWVLSGTGTVSTGYTMTAAGNKTLSGVLDRIRLTTVNGTNTFDAGSINILYE
jgi:hypothetical protein